MIKTMIKTKRNFINRFLKVLALVLILVFVMLCIMPPFQYVDGDFGSGGVLYDGIAWMPSWGSIRGFRGLTG